jgi:hypothetical protein
VVAGFATPGAVTVDAAAGTRALGLTLSGDTGANVSDATATTVNVKTTSSASTGVELDFLAATSIVFNDTVDLSLSELAAPAATSLTIAGAGDFLADDVLLAKNGSVNATQSSGTVAIAMLPSNSFTGGSGQDIVTLFGVPKAAITGGSNANNEIVLRDAGFLDASSIDPALVSHFSTLGISGDTYGLIDMGRFPAIHRLEIENPIAVPSPITFFHVASGAELSIDADYHGVVTLVTADATAASDVATLKVGTAESTGIVVNEVVLQNSSFLDIGTVNVVSNGSGVNTLGFLNVGTGNIALTTLNLSGTAGLAILTRIGGNSTSVHVLGAHDDANITLFLENGSNVVELGRGSNNIDVGTGANSISYGAHTGGADTTTVGANASLTTLTAITGAVVGDHLNIADAGAFNPAAVTAAQVTAAGGSTGTLAGWVTGALAAAGDNLAQHSATWFQFHGNTYVVEQAAATGTAFGAGDTLVELVGLHDLSSGFASGAGAIVL